MFWGRNNGLSRFLFGRTSGMSLVPAGFFAHRALGILTRNMLVMMVFGMAFAVWAIGPVQIQELASESLMFVQVAIEKERESIKAELAKGGRKLEKDLSHKNTSDASSRSGKAGPVGQGKTETKDRDRLEAELERLFQTLADALGKAPVSDGLLEKRKPGPQRPPDTPEPAHSKEKKK